MTDREVRELPDSTGVIVAPKGYKIVHNYNEPEHTRLRWTTVPVGNPPPDPDPTPDPPPTDLHVLDVGFVTVQGEVSATRALLKADGWTTAQHMEAFGSACDHPTNAGSLLDANGGKGWLYAGMGSADVNNGGLNGCSSPDSRRPDTAAKAALHADRCWDVLKSRPGIIGVTFWQEMKGYGVNSNSLFNSHYTAFAQRLRALGFTGIIAGPYTTGGYSDAQNEGVHRDFLQGVFAPHPELVGAIAYDANDGAKAQMYADWASKYGAGSLPQINTELYPGGWQSTSVNQRTDGATLARCLLKQATVRSLHWTMIWSTGGGGEDKSQKAQIVNASGQPTALYTLLRDTIRPFLRGGNVTAAGTDRWTNAAGKTLTISGSSVTVS